MALRAASHPRDLTDEQWDLIGRFLPEPVRRADGRGRPWREKRAVLNGILWILRTGAPWADLPHRYPSYQTCHRRFQQWVRAGVLRSILETLARHSMTKAIWISRRRSSMGASLQRSGEEPAWARRSAARGRRSWLSPIVRAPGRRPRRERHAARSHTGTRHTRGAVCQATPGASHRRQRLRVGPTGCGLGPLWRGTDRATPEDPDTADARRSAAASLPTAVEDRATLCLVPELSADRRAL